MNIKRIQYLLLSCFFSLLIAQNNFPQNENITLTIGDTSLVYKLSFLKNKAQDLLNIADSLVDNNQDSASIKYYEDALELFLIMDDSSRIEYCYYSIGVSYYYTDNEKRAIDYLKKTLSFKDEKGNRRLRRYGFLSDSYYYLGEIDSSIHYLEKAYKLSKQLNEFDWLKSIVEDLVRIYSYDKVNSKKVINYLKEGADLFAGVEPYITAINYFSIGEEYLKADYTEAIKAYEKSKKIWVKYIPNYQDSLSYFRLIDMLNLTYHIVGNYDSLETIQSEITNMSIVKNLDTIDERKRLDMMVDFNIAIGRDTEMFYEKYLELRKKIRKKINSQQYVPNNLDLARLNQELAWTFNLYTDVLNQKVYDETDSAVYYFSKSLKYYLSAKNNLPTKSLNYDDSNLTQEDILYEVMSCRIDLATNFTEMKKHQHAITLLEQNLIDYNKTTDEDFGLRNYLYLRTLGTLGLNSVSMEDYDKAIEYFELTSSLNDQSLAFLGIDMFWLAYCYYFKKDYKKSIEYFIKELRIHKKNKAIEEILLSNYNIAESYIMIDQYDKSITYLDSAIYILDKLINSLGDLNKINLLNKHISSIQLQIYNYFITGNKSKLIEIIEKYRSLVLKDRLAINNENSNFEMEELHSSLRDDECIILFANVDMKAVYNSMNNPEIIHPIIIFIDKDNIVAKKISITDTSKTRSNMDKVMELEIKYLLNSSIYYRTNSDNTLQKKFYNDFLIPFEHLLHNKNKINFMIDGALYLLPMELLIDTNGEYLINSYDISYISSLQLFINNRTKAVSERKMPNVLAIGSPKFSDTTVTINRFLDDENIYRTLISKIHANESLKEEFAYLGYTVWDSLPGALNELNSISKIFNDVRKLTGTNATELSVKILNDLNNYDILHFATHSIIIDGIPQASSIVLSPSQNSTDDGYLNINEISKLNIKSSFVNLASCESGAGEILPSQGIYSFTQAFEYAGAQSVLVSLWPIADEATSIFMTSFYSKIASGSLYNHALSEVKREFIAGEYGEAYKHPFYWAPFVYYGK